MLFVWNKGFVEVQTMENWKIGNRLQMGMTDLLQVC